MNPLSWNWRPRTADHLRYNFEIVRDQVVNGMSRLAANGLASMDSIDLIDTVQIRHCIECDREHKRRWRQFCHTMHKEGIICCARDIEDLEPRNIRGLMWHEFGHILSEEDLLNFPVFGLDVIPDRTVIHFVMDDSEVDAEVFADAVIERLFDRRIFYDEKKLQWVEED